MASLNNTLIISLILSVFRLAYISSDCQLPHKIYNKKDLRLCLRSFSKRIHLIIMNGLEDYKYDTLIRLVQLLKRTLWD